eukprot:11805061-Alexandrium_andersonii.AAC.1
MRGTPALVQPFVELCCLPELLVWVEARARGELHWQAQVGSIVRVGTLTGAIVRNVARWEQMQTRGFAT